MSEQMKKRGRGRPRNPTTDAIAKKLNLTKRSAERMAKRGIDPSSLADIESARLAKLQKEVEVLTEKLAILRRDHVPAAKVREDAIAAFSILRQAITGQEVQLPPLLEGLNAKEMRTVIAGHGQRMLRDLSERIASIP